jgi:hypothetical protein
VKRIFTRSDNRRKAYRTWNEIIIIKDVLSLFWHNCFPCWGQTSIRDQNISWLLLLNQRRHEESNFEGNGRKSLIIRKTAMNWITQESDLQSQKYRRWWTGREVKWIKKLIMHRVSHKKFIEKGDKRLRYSSRDKCFRHEINNNIRLTILLFPLSPLSHFLSCKVWHSRDIPALDDAFGLKREKRMTVDSPTSLKSQENKWLDRLLSDFNEESEKWRQKTERNKRWRIS